MLPLRDHGQPSAPTGRSIAAEARPLDRPWRLAEPADVGRLLQEQERRQYSDTMPLRLPMTLPLAPPLF